MSWILESLAGPAGPWLAFLANNALKATLLLVAACAVTLALRRASAAVRHLVWTAAIVGLLALPVLSLILPAWQVAPLEPASHRLAASSHTAGPLTVRPAGRVVRGSPVPAPSPPRTPARWPAWALATWAAGLLAAALRLLIGAGRVWWMTRDARPIRLPEWNSILAGLAGRIGLARPVSLLESDRALLPMTWGVWHPVILLPGHAQRWSPERRRLVLSHELIHVRRLDHLGQLLAQIACSLYWFHPLAWWAAGQLRKERERACDDGVLGLGVKGSAYAAHLLDLVRSLPAKEPWSMAVAMAHTSHLENRLLALLNPQLNRQALSGRAAALTAIFAAGLILPLAAIGAQAPKASGTISGVVYDASGARVPDAIITASNLDADNKETASTSQAGEYTFVSIPLGRYAVEVRKPGFKLFQHKEVVVSANAAARLDATLEIGSVMETVDVVAQTPRLARPMPRVVPQRIRIGGNVQATKLIYMSKPVYPEQAKEQGIEGTVLLRGIIGTDGSLLSLSVINALANPELAKAALEAVRQWRYKPTLLNGLPVEVVTTIAVNFRLAD